MTNPFTPLSEDEFNELEQFLLYDVDTEEGMTLDMADGFLHAIAVGPTTTHPKQWLPKIWGTSEMMAPMDSIEQLNHILRLVHEMHGSTGGASGGLAEAIVQRKSNEDEFNNPPRTRKFGHSQGGGLRPAHLP